MDHPQIMINLNRIYHPKSIALEPQGNFEHTGPHSCHRLRDIGLASLRRNRQRGETDLLSAYRETLELFSRGLEP